MSSLQFNLRVTRARVNPSIKTDVLLNLGATRGKGSASRMYTHCKNNSRNQSSCISNFATITPTTTVPSAPTLSATLGDNGLVNLTWTAPASDGGSTITGYNVYESGTINNAYSGSQSYSNTYKYSASTFSSSIYLYSSLSYGDTTNIVVYAINANGNGSSSNTITENDFVF